ncbi:hypothetical protein K458DRAFT_427680 [Lentithecium fluviatile CBS 122367]|uniref:Uncharacterized protein n=1 Tax=Lentithecium fluviatile CBS 122367 TaxID=1168545 RepID=A0A6G1JHC9_9PLEO|nr:hypothetical protein K458DRAFT_427680 [Lentithecium fluviatile CBS 122367]
MPGAEQWSHKFDCEQRHLSKPTGPGPSSQDLAYIEVLRLEEGVLPLQLPQAPTESYWCENTFGGGVSGLFGQWRDDTDDTGTAIQLKCWGSQVATHVSGLERNTAEGALDIERPCCDRPGGLEDSQVLHPTIPGARLIRCGPALVTLGLTGRAYNDYNG